MEIEIKYQLPDTDTADDIWISQDLMKISDPSSIETVPMHAVYYDTKDRRLRKAAITLRVRREGSDAFCTIKWDGRIVRGVHEREELNIPVDIALADQVPDISVLGSTEKGAEIMQLIKNAPLEPLIVMDFTRRRKKLSFEGNIIELALDRGTISTVRNQAPILELELEHYAGKDPFAVLALGEVLAAKYGLTLQKRSKYARGLELLSSGLYQPRPSS